MLRQEHETEHFYVISDYCIVEVCFRAKFLHIIKGDGKGFRFVILLVCESKLSASELRRSTLDLKLFLKFLLSVDDLLLLVFAESLKKFILSLLTKVSELQVGYPLLNGLFQETVWYFIEDGLLFHRLFGRS